MIRSVAVVAFAAEAEDAEIAAFASAVAELPDAVGCVVQRFSSGRNLGLPRGNRDFAVVADFATEADFAVYDQHPAHQRIRDRWVGTLVREATVVQYELADKLG